jgi:superfamily II DNA/RNA helicase/cold shock CspA family protein
MTIHTNGFADLGVPKDLCAPLARTGITTPFPIQSAVIPDALVGRDICGRAPTGSGKTLAFGLPLAASLQAGSSRRPTALVLAPTRELADQIANELRPFVSVRNHAVVAIYGGVGYGAQRKALAAGAELVVACPGRLEDLIATGDIMLDRVSHVVIDEADRMSDMGFLPAVRRILGLVGNQRQVQLFSATLDGAVTKLASAVQTSPARHEVGPKGPDMAATHHVFWEVVGTERAAATASAIKTMGSTIVFCRTRHGADRLAKQLARHGVSAAPIHGGRSQPQRDRALRSFSTGEVSSLIATDVAARGVHVDGVAAIVHFDPPADSTTYVHRSGRTARAGASGVVVSLIAPNAKQEARRLQTEVGISAAISSVDVAALREAGRNARSTAEGAPAPAAVAPQLHAAAGRVRGTLKIFHGNRGYGFIDHGTGRDLFVHQSQLSGPHALASGQSVEFAVGEGRRGPEAVDVRVLVH